MGANEIVERRKHSNSFILFYVFVNAQMFTIAFTPFWGRFVKDAGKELDLSGRFEPSPRSYALGKTRFLLLKKHLKNADKT